MINLGSMTSKNPKISAIIITKNEENNIKECLKSIKEIVDEIIIVDSYSTDRTIKIAEKYTKKIFLKKFEDNFSKQRNFALRQTQGEWILSIDADERLSLKLKKEIPKLIQTSNFKGYLFSRKNYIDSQKWLRYGIFYPDWQLRLFKKGVKFKGTIHERLDLDEKYCQKINLDIIHNASHTKYDKFSSIFRLKEFVKIQAKEIIKKEKNFLLFPFIGFFNSCKYFLDSFIFGKGFLDGWNGFRSALIFSLFVLKSYTYSFFLRIFRK